MNNNRFPLILTPSSLACLVLLLSIIPLGLFLPPEWGRENWPVENSQLLIVILTCLAAFAAYKRGTGTAAVRELYLWLIPLLIIVAARELSWGRVFYPNGNGWFLPLDALWYGKFVYPLVGLTIIGVFGGLRSKGLDRELYRWLKSGRFPLIDIVLIVGTVFAADLIEHRIGQLLLQRQELFEELFELVMYCGFLSLVINTGFNKNFQFQPQHLFYRKES